MAHGVTVNFLEILDHERTRRRRFLVAAPILAWASLFLAELSDAPAWGSLMTLTGVAIVVGLAAGLLWSWRGGRQREASIRARWERWMRWSFSASDLTGLQAQVEEHPQRLTPARLGLAAGVLVGLNALLFAVLWYAWPQVPAPTSALLVLDGLAVGALAGTSAWTLWWVRRFRGALDELVAEGQVGVWGEV